MINDALQYAETHRDQFLSELKEFLSIPSISALSDHKPDIQRAAQWLADHFTAIGLHHAQVHQTAGHPIVTADWLEAGSDQPTVLIYGHYDVQPIDPIELWQSDPFKPEVRGDYVFARGTADDKGQVFIHAKVIESYLKTTGRLPVNVKIIVEGEEEIGGPNVEIFIKSHLDDLQADVCLISDSHMLRPDQPAIIYGLRGLTYLEIEVIGPSLDLHSGMYGGAIYNPIQALVEMLASLKNKNGRITVPGFYKNVRPLTKVERKVLAKTPFNKKEFMHEAGVNKLWGEKGYTPVEQITARPTLELNGIWGGWMGEGSKTVLPSKAYAKLSCRLVADQDYIEIRDLLTKHLKKIAPKEVSLNVKWLHGGQGALVSLDSPYMRAAAKVLQQVFGHAPIYLREGGSIPVVASFQELLGIDSILMGFGLPDDNLHSPNERFYLPNFYNGIEATIRYLNEVTK
jgi:acetylornithine deacetylase/succinyl-diaminopimelate desuccinylase-like protein